LSRLRAPKRMEAIAINAVIKNTTHFIIFRTTHAH